MCGITLLVTKQNDKSNDVLRRSLKKIRHRGPDFSGRWSSKDQRVFACHERLAIVKPESGEQPLYNQSNTMVLIVNGEIYNYKELAVKYDLKVDLKSDCDVAVQIFDKTGDIEELCNVLYGVYSFCLFDTKTNKLHIVRDRMGVMPLYIGVGSDSIMISSELKGLTDHNIERMEQFPPGCYLTLSIGEDDASLHQLCGKALSTPPPENGLKHVLFDYKQYWSPLSLQLDASKVPASFELAAKAVHDTLKQATFTRLENCDVPFGVLLSGGLDSSVIASLAAQYVKQRTNSGSGVSVGRLHTFSVGMKSSPDLVAARRVAEFIGSTHHELVFTFDQALQIVHEVIFQLETYDPTTIRSSVPMSLMMRMIKSFGIKMVLSGEGADEIFGGYLYFHHCPSDEEFETETRDKLCQLYHYDILRANKCGAMWGVEVRVPFLSQTVIELALKELPANMKRPIPRPDGDKDVNIEKCLVRYAFRDNYLPEEVLWRQKEQFSDGVGYSWIDGIKKHAEEQIDDLRFARRATVYPFQTPQTKEEMFYRDIFEQEFEAYKPASNRQVSQTAVFTQASVACSTGAGLRWMAAKGQVIADPSGRSVLNIHKPAN